MKPLPDYRIAGVDFGKKFNGSTVICFLTGETLTWYVTQKNQNADKFLYEHLTHLAPDGIFLDAPLSLPGVYWLEGEYADYFYRIADKKLKAMSPMFLAGLSARSIRLKDQLQAAGITCCEAYPGGLAREWQLHNYGYKGKQANLSGVQSLLQEFSPLDLSGTTFPDWHHVDALLAALTGLRYFQNIHRSFGNQPEGTILV